MGFRGCRHLCWNLILKVLYSTFSDAILECLMFLRMYAHKVPLRCCMLTHFVRRASPCMWGVNDLMDFSGFQSGVDWALIWNHLQAFHGTCLNETLIQWLNVETRKAVHDLVQQTTSGPGDNTEASVHRQYLETCLTHFPVPWFSDSARLPIYH